MANEARLHKCNTAAARPTGGKCIAFQLYCVFQVFQLATTSCNNWQPLTTSLDGVRCMSLKSDLNVDTDIGAGTARASTQSECGCLCNATSLYNDKLCLSSKQDLTYMSFSWICLVQDRKQLKDCTCSDTQTKRVYRAYWLDQHKKVWQYCTLWSLTTIQTGVG